MEGASINAQSGHSALDQFRRKQNSVLVKQWNTKSSDYCVDQTDDLCVWLLLLLTAALRPSCWVFVNTRTHFRVYWIRIETRLSSRLTLESAWWDLLWEMIIVLMGKRRVCLGLSCNVSIIASHRVPPSPDDFLAGSDRSLQLEKEKIRQSSLYFSLLKDEGGNEIRTGESIFLVFFLSFWASEENGIGQSGGLFCAVAIFLPLWRRWITQTPANMLDINN